MSRNALVLLAVLLTACASTETGAHVASVPGFAYAVASMCGDVQLRPGDDIVIDEVRGTDPTFVLGGTYHITGRYRLSSVPEASLMAFITKRTDTGGSTPAPASRVQLTRGEGQFALDLTLATYGYPHLTFYGDDGYPIGGVYFGADTWLLKKKDWSHLTPVPKPVLPREPDFELL